MIHVEKTQTFEATGTAAVAAIDGDRVRPIATVDTDTFEATGTLAVSESS